LHEAFLDTGLTLVQDDGFCLRRPADDPNSETCCFNFFGRPAVVPPSHPPPNVFAQKGQLLTTPIDSGVPRCRWHRVRVEADVPVATGVAIAVATAESVEDVVAQGQADPEWPGFATGIPDPLDWQVVTGTQDFLVDQPPGRYLYLRVRLTSDGGATPTVRSIRCDFPRATSVDALPAVYREDPRAEDFTERFVALFDAALEDLDTAIERFPALLDIENTPRDVLPWLGRFLGTAFDPAWSAARRRSILAKLPRLYERRGTPAGLAEAVRLVFDVVPVIEEIDGASVFGAVSATGRRSGVDARLGAVRLFSRARSRFRLGTSALGRAPLRSYGDPSLDPLSSGAFRFRVLLPADMAQGTATLARLRRLVDSQKPAHTIASVSVGSSVPVLGGELRVGIDTRLGAPPPPVLGVAGNVRLGRDAILHGGTRSGIVVDPTPATPSPC
jgi:phage tail-like protein